MKIFKTRETLNAAFKGALSPRPAWLANNVRSTTWSLICQDPGLNAFGMRCDRDPVTAKIVEVKDGIVIGRLKPSKFIVIDAAMLSIIPAIGQTYVFETHRLKSLIDGLPLQAGRRSENSAFIVTKIGDTHTVIPGNPDDPYLCDLKEQLEHLKMPDRQRTISNAMADWHAKDFKWSANEETLSYELSWSMSSPNYTGRAAIQYDRGADTYIVVYTGDDGPTEIHNVHFDEIGTHLSQLAGDSETWFTVETTLAKKRAAA